MTTAILAAHRSAFCEMFFLAAAVFRLPELQGVSQPMAFSRHGNIFPEMKACEMVRAAEAMEEAEVADELTKEAA